MVLAELITLQRLEPQDAPAHVQASAYPSSYLFQYKGDARGMSPEEAATSVTSITVLLTGNTYIVSEWIEGKRAIALACVLVQEDFILLKKQPGSNSKDFTYVFVAGAACFAFSEVGLRGERGFMKLGEPMQWIHTNVTRHVVPTVMVSYLMTGTWIPGAYLQDGCTGV